MAYDGPERRNVSIPAEYIDMIARVDERTKAIFETMPTKSDVLAAMNAAQNADKKIMEHIENHRWNAGTIISILAGGGGIAAGVAAILSLPKGH